VQHVNVKIFAVGPAIELDGAIPVFHRWIQDRVCEELLIDVADYRHVPAGPGVLLVGHEANYSLDLSFSRLGLLYNRKVRDEGSAQDNLVRSFRAALAACERLEQEPEFQGRLKFNAGDCEVILNDRLLAPNTEATWQALKPEFEKFFDSLYGGVSYTFESSKDPRERFRVGVKANGAVELNGAGSSPLRHPISK
jgi:hypothetical protein